MKCSSYIPIAIVVFCFGPMMAISQTGPGRGYAKIPEGAYSIIAEVHAKPGKREDLRAATLPLIHLVRSDPKNLVYFFQEDRENPGHFIFFEVFATKEDFDAHNNMPYVKEWFAKLPELAEGGVKTTRMEIEPPAAQ
jgi:quinol monooxygenase YgiN